jgi:hypothetical protein
MPTVKNVWKIGGVRTVVKNRGEADIGVPGISIPEGGRFIIHGTAKNRFLWEEKENSPGFLRAWPLLIPQVPFRVRTLAGADLGA